MHVVEVVRGRGTTVRHVPPALGRALVGPDALGVDDVVEPERAGVRQQVVGDVPAELARHITGAVIPVDGGQVLLSFVFPFMETS